MKPREIDDLIEYLEQRIAADLRKGYKPNAKLQEWIEALKSATIIELSAQEQVEVALAVHAAPGGDILAASRLGMDVRLRPGICISLLITKEGGT